tara:strand:- start:1558 stop:1917 length:360 start_codon:yes stop_codon:yes gene_type:complete
MMSKRQIEDCKALAVKLFTQVEYVPERQRLMRVWYNQWRSKHGDDLADQGWALVQSHLDALEIGAKHERKSSQKKWHEVWAAPIIVGIVIAIFTFGLSQCSSSSQLNNSNRQNGESGSD